MQRRRKIAKITGGFSPNWSPGQGAAEFAMVAISVLTLILAIMQGAAAVSAYNFVTYAARDASRYAMVRGATSPNPVSSDDVKAFVIAEAQGIDTSPSKLTVTTTWTPANNKNPGSVVNVTVAYNFAPLASLASHVVVPLSSTSKMVISQ